MNRHFFEAHLGGLLRCEVVSERLNRIDSWIRCDALIDLGDR